ncbi:MAG: extracellular solute-binding protein [Xanthobacteraceae bacterium]|nr:extracellular solute-binding protein [Xanthobacteraceae bacterium]
MSASMWLRVSLLVAAASFGAIATAVAQTKTDAPAIYTDKSPDREQRLIAAAKKEGSVTFYTSMQTQESGPLAKAFEAKYGIKVQLWRATSDQVIQRVVNEARANRQGMDVLETNAPEVDQIARENIVAAFHSAHSGDLPDWAIPPHRRWYAARANLWVVAFNTTKVKKEEIPPTYEGFVDPKWKGRIGIESTDEDWMYAVINYLGVERGMEMFRKLAALRPDMRLGHALLAQLIGAGEIQVGLTVYSGNADSIKKRGGPVDWVAVEPIVGRPQAVAVARNARNPNAALLFAEFMLSTEGQKLLNSLDRNPSSKREDTLLTRFKYQMVDPIKWTDEAPRWEKLWQELFLKR